MSTPKPASGPSDSIIILKIIGQICFLAGAFGLWHYFHAGTSVHVPGSTHDFGLGPVYVPGSRVENLGLISRRETGLFVSGIGVLAGILLMFLPRDNQSKKGIERLILTLPSDLLASLEAEALRRGIDRLTLVRQVLEGYLAPPGAGRGTASAGGLGDREHSHGINTAA